jgi:ketosteroid isomerase-like protein
MKTEVLAAATRLCDAFAQGRIDDYFACFAPQANFIFHSLPGRIDSLADYRQHWADWKRDLGLEILGCDSFDRTVQLFGDTAVYTHSVTVRVRTRDAGDQTRHERETIVFVRNANARWEAVHEHLSKDPAAL